MPTPTPKLDQEHDNLDLVSRDSIRELSEQDPLSIAIAICRANDCPALSRLENSRARLEELYKVKAGPRVKPRQLDQADNPMTNEATFNKLRDTAINDEAKFENLRDVAAALPDFHAPPYAPLYGQSFGRWWNNPEHKLEDLLKFRGPLDGRYGSRQLAQDQGLASFLKSDEAIRQALEIIDRNKLEDPLKYQAEPKAAPEIGQVRFAGAKTDGAALEIGQVVALRAKTDGAAPNVDQVVAARAKTDGAAAEIN